MAVKSGGVKFRMKRLFFDRKYVENVLGKRSAKALGKAGAFVQRRARSSLRRRKAVSQPGQPPSVHSSDSVATLKNIWFALDQRSLSVIVGPLKLNLHSVTRGGFGPWHDTVFGSGAVPGTLEHGGLIGVRKIQDESGNWSRVPFGHKRGLEKLIPVWKATPRQRAASSGVHTIRKGKRALNFYKIPHPPSRIDWAKIAPRPFMFQAIEKEAPNFPSLWLQRAG